MSRDRVSATSKQPSHFMFEKRSNADTNEESKQNEMMFDIANTHFTYATRYGQNAWK